METQVQYSQHTQGMKQPQIIGDIIDQLPFDQTVPSHNEIRIIDSLFQQKKGVVDKILKNIKDILIIGILFVIFSLPPVDEIIKKFITITATSPYILIGVKALLFMIAYFVFNNFYLSRNK